MEEITMWKTGERFSTHRRPIERDVAQLGSVFVLDTKCHGFQSCHPYLLLWAVTKVKIDSNLTCKIFHLMILDACKM